MSRSRKHHPICGITCKESEKKDKILYHKRERRTNKQILKNDLDETKLKKIKEVSSIWLFDKDGKQRFDPKEHPKLMRK